MSGFLSWWDGFELWLSGLGFVAQSLLIMPVALLLAYGIAVTVDVALGCGIRGIRGVRGGIRRARSPRPDPEPNG